MRTLNKLLCAAAMLVAMGAFASCGVDVANSGGSSGFPNSAGGSASVSAPKSDLRVTIEGLEEGVVSVEYNGEPAAVSYAADVALKVVYSGNGDTVYETSETAPVNAGTYKVVLSYDGDGTYNAYEKEVLLEITKARGTLEISVENVDEGEIVAPKIVSNTAGKVTYSYKGRGETVYEESETPPTEVGTYTVTATAEATDNYFGVRRSADFEIYSKDPLYGLSEEIRSAVAARIRLDGITLADRSYNTNETDKAGISRSGVIRADNTGLMLLSEGFDAERYTIIVKSDKAVRAYFRFAVEGGNSYETVVNEDANYTVKQGDAAISAGISVIQVSLRENGGFVGDRTAAIKGVHILFDGSADVTIYGFYKPKAAQMSEVPEELKKQADEKIALEYSGAAASYNTNENLLTFGNILVVENEFLAVRSKNLPKKIYLLVKSEKECYGYFRFACNNVYSYADIVNEPGMSENCKYRNDVAFKAGYQFVEINMSEYGDFKGDADAEVTGFHLMFNTKTMFTLYGIYADEQPEVPVDPPEKDEIPEGLKLAVADKALLDYTVAAGSWNTNAETVKAEDGSVTAANTCLELNVSVKTGKIYLLVKSEKAVTGYFRFAVNGKTGYAAIVNECEANCKYKNDETIAEGYSLLEITLNAYGDYKGDADAEVTGFHLMFSSKTTFTVYGIYADEQPEVPVDPPEKDEIPEGLKQAVADKALLDYTVAAGSWDTNAETVKAEDGSVTATNTCLELNVSVKTGKIYLLVKSEKAVTGYFRFAVNGKTGYAAIVNECEANCKYKNDETIAEGYSLLEITLNAYGDYKGDADAEVTGFHLMFSSKTTFTVYGIYADKSTESPEEPSEDEIPETVESLKPETSEKN